MQPFLPKLSQVKTKRGLRSPFNERYLQPRAESEIGVSQSTILLPQNEVYKRKEKTDAFASRGQRNSLSKERLRPTPQSGNQDANFFVRSLDQSLLS